MKILYLANFENKGSDKTEKHIKHAFEELGHKVIPIDENDTSGLLNHQDADMFLFHKAGVGRIMDLTGFAQILCHMTPKKVAWYFDKVEGERNKYVETCAMYADHLFLTDDTWRRRRKYENVHCLRQGIGSEDYRVGKKREEYECDIAFVGSIYGEREKWARQLKTVYGDKIKFFNNVFNEDLYDLCASAKIILAPKYPSNDFYWSSRIYMILGSGGFLIHPDLYGLKDEFVEGKHFAGYRNNKEMIMTIEYFLQNEKERKQIQKQGQEHCLKVATYKKRVEEMLNKVYGDQTPKRNKPKIKKK
jgi:hypothetical protein